MVKAVVSRGQIRPPERALREARSQAKKQALEDQSGNHRVSIGAP